MLNCMTQRIALKNPGYPFMFRLVLQGEGTYKKARRKTLPFVVTGGIKVVMVGKAISHLSKPDSFMHFPFDF